MSVVDDVASDLKNGRLMLFAGAGVSAILGLPSWSGLIGQMAKELGFDNELFQEMGTYPTLAEFYAIEKRSINPLVDWMNRKWSKPAVAVEKSTVHRDLVRANFPIIYTTNYDSWIEAAYDYYRVPYSKIVTGEDIAKIREGSVQIIKFHGDLNVPTTLVLTESHYFERLRFEAELDIKLLSDLLRYSTLFVGYSLSDINMRNMLYRLALFRSKYTSPDRHLQSYIFADRHNQVQARVLESWGIRTIFSEALDRRQGLEQFFHRLTAGSGGP